MPAEGNPWFTQLLRELLPRLRAETDPGGSSFGTAKAFLLVFIRSVLRRSPVGSLSASVEIREINKPGTDCSCLKSLCQNVSALRRSTCGS